MKPKKNWLNRPLTLLLCALLLPAALSARNTTEFPVSSGTGFYVSNMGYVVTNKHVVEGCKRAVIRGAMSPEKVDVVATDPNHDLALLRSQRAPVYTAPLRYNIEDLKKGDPVLVMGYPGTSAATGEYRLTGATVLDVIGPLGDPDSIQFSDSVQQGNSGGPLLDKSGNVIGVIVAKSIVWEIDPITQIKQNEYHSDVAISLKVLRPFLERHGVYARDLTSVLNLTRDRIEDQAKSYIVNILCSPNDGTRTQRLDERILDELSKQGNLSIRIKP